MTTFARTTLSRTALCVLLTTSIAHAQPSRSPKKENARTPSSENAAAAESLFQDARKLAADKRYAEACPKFAASQHLAPALGTLLNLGDCYEKLGKTASAWASFVDAASVAQRMNRPEREQTARSRAAALEPKLSRLTLRIEKAAPGVVVKRDGVVLDEAALGVAMPLDPGPHELSATAPGRKPWTTTLEVAPAAQLDVAIPELDEEPRFVEPAPLDTSQIEEPAPPSDSWKTRRAFGYGLVGLGVAGVATGSFFGLKASSAWSDAKGLCTGNLCNEEGVTRGDDAKTAGNISTVAFVVGAVALTTGVILILTAPSPSKSAPPTARGPGLLHGSF